MSMFATLCSSFPLGAAGLLALKDLGDCFTDVRASPPDAQVQQIFQSILKECGLLPRSYRCQVGRVSDSEAHAYGKGVVLLSSETAKALVGEDPQQRLRARSIVKHELGHLYHQDTRWHVIASGIALVALYQIQSFLYDPIQGLYDLPGGRIWYGCAVMGATCAQLNLLWRARTGMLCFEERRADAFAIQHANDAHELKAAADGFEKEFDDFVETAKTLKMGSWTTLFTGGLYRGQDYSFPKEYQRTKLPRETMKEWCIRNRGQYPEMGNHPSAWTRREDFLAATTQKRE